MRTLLRTALPGLALALLLALVAACSRATPETASPTSTPAGPARGGPALAFDTLQVDLGSVARDQQGLQTFLVLNQGNELITVGPVTMEVLEGSPAAEPPKGTIDVKPGDAVLLPILFKQHEQLGSHRVQFNVPSTDPKRPMTSLSVRFTVEEDPQPAGPGPRLKVDKEVVDIGAVAQEFPLFQVFTLRNIGDAPLVLDGTPTVRVEEGC